MSDFTIDHDDLWPRDEAHRYRLYAVRGDEREVLAATPTMGGIGLAIGIIHDDCKQAGKRLADLGMVGIYDAINGEWILLPFTRQETM